MSKPSILLIPGSFGLPDFYDTVINSVAAKGYEIRGLHYPSVGLKTGPREGTPPTMYDDAAFIAEETQKLADSGKHVILLAHSYGGIPTTQSTKGLSRGERKKEGKSGGIVRLAYMTCIVPALGGSAASSMAEVPEDSKIDLKIDEKGWMYHDLISRSAAICFSNLPKEEGESWVLKFVQHSAASFASELTHAGYKDIPVSYLVCEQDLCIPPKNQRAGIDLIEDVSGRKVDVRTIQADHCPTVSAEQEVVDWILDVVRTVEKDGSIF